MAVKYYEARLSIFPDEVWIGHIPIKPGQIFEMKIKEEWKTVKLEEINNELLITGLPFKISYGIARLNIYTYDQPQYLYTTPRKYNFNLHTFLKENTIILSEQEHNALLTALIFHKEHDFPQQFTIIYTAFKYNVKQSMLKKHLKDMLKKEKYEQLSLPLF